MKRTPLSAYLLLSFVLILSCGKGSKTPTAPLEDNYTISGTVAGVDSVTVTLSGNASATWTVKKSGESYSFTAATGGSYTITPSKSGYTFTPSDKTIKNLSANLTQNFDAKLASYTLSGKVTGADSVLVTLSGGSSATWMVTKSGGTYSFNVVGLGTYTITPTKKGYGFIPYNKTYQNLSANQTQSFYAKLPFVNNDITFFSIPAGSFLLGSFIMNISSFEIGIYEVTQGQYKAVMGANPSYFSSDDNLPVEQVIWWDAIKFCNALSRKKGLKECYIESTGACDFSKNGIRLPTEAEWEYACRAGTTTNYYTGDNENDLARAGWYGENSQGKTHPVGGKEPNAWGLYDMHGNVAEWCNDWSGNYSSGSMTDPRGPASGDKRVLRGGGWSYNYYYCRSAYQGSYDPNERNYVNGFRVVSRP